VVSRNDVANHVSGKPHGNAQTLRHLHRRGCVPADCPASRPGADGRSQVLHHTIQPLHVTPCGGIDRTIHAACPCHPGCAATIAEPGRRSLPACSHLTEVASDISEVAEQGLFFDPVRLVDGRTISDDPQLVGRTRVVVLAQLPGSRRGDTERLSALQCPKSRNSGLSRPSWSPGTRLRREPAGSRFSPVERQPSNGSHSVRCVSSSDT
jgi:hypothetical protein